MVMKRLWKNAIAPLETLLGYRRHGAQIATLFPTAAADCRLQTASSGSAGTWRDTYALSISSWMVASIIYCWWFIDHSVCRRRTVTARPLGGAGRKAAVTLSCFAKICYADNYGCVFVFSLKTSRTLVMFTPKPSWATLP